MPLDFQWTITSGADKVSFPGGTSTYYSGSDPFVQGVYSTGASTPAQTLTYDVTIQLEQAGTLIATAQMAVARPDHLTPAGVTDGVDATYGYYAYVAYHIQDQFNRDLPRRVEINEQWTTGVAADSVGMDWRRGPEGAATVNPNVFNDFIQGETAGHTPVPQNPQNPLGNTRVYHWGQAWYVGSLTIGAGQKVQTNTLQKYQDHARHENITSPP